MDHLQLICSKFYHINKCVVLQLNVTAINVISEDKSGWMGVMNSLFNYKMVLIRER